MALVDRDEGYNCERSCSVSPKGLVPGYAFDQVLPALARPGANAVANVLALCGT